LHGEEGLKEGSVSEISLRLESSGDALEGDGVVLEGVERVAPDALEELVEGEVLVE
jgi:hypothetical protein